MYCQGRRQMKNKRINCLKWSLISAHLEAITSTSVSHLEPLSRVTGVLLASPTQGNWCPPSLSHSGELVSSQPLPLRGTGVLPASPTQGNCPFTANITWPPVTLFTFQAHTQCAHTCSTMPYTCLVSVLDCPTTTQGEHGDRVFTLMTTTVGIN